MSFSEASKETIHLQHLLKHIGFCDFIKGAITVFYESKCDIIK